MLFVFDAFADCDDDANCNQRDCECACQHAQQREDFVELRWWIRRRFFDGDDYFGMIHCGLECSNIQRVDADALN